MFYKGQNVVCVDDSYPEHRKHLHSLLPVKGQIYTVRGIGDFGGVYLEESIGLLNYSYGIEYSFKGTRFRPVIKTEFDLSIFTDILNKNKVPELV